jgi:hypothetical protein
MPTNHRPFLRTLVALLVGLLVMPAAAFAQQGSTTMKITIDTPTGNMTVTNGQSINIGGWALDTASTSGSGVDRVEIYVDGQRGSATLAAEATYGLPSPDVANVFSRSDWNRARFDVSWTPRNLPPGDHSIHVYARSTRGEWSSSSVIVAAVNPPLAEVLPPIHYQATIPLDPHPLPPLLPPPGTCSFGPFPDVVPGPMGPLALPPCPR